jgi:hypothetical protein
MFRELATPGATEAQLVFLAELGRTRAATDPVGTLELIKSLRSQGVDISAVTSLLGWSREHPEQFLDWIMRNPGGLADLSASDFQKVVQSAVEGRAYFFSDDYNSAFLTSDDRDTVMINAGRWRNAETRTDAETTIMGGPHAREVLRSVVDLAAGNGSSGLTDWIEQLPIAAEERAGLLARALRTMAGEEHVAFTIDSLGSEKFQSLSSDAAFAAVAGGALRRDGATALAFAGAIADEASRAHELALGALYQLTTNQGDPAPWLARLPWAVGDGRYAALYGIAAARLLARGTERAVVEGLLQTATNLDQQQKIDIMAGMKVPAR